MLHRILTTVMLLALISLTLPAQPLFYKDGAYMGTEFGLYSKQRFGGSNDMKKYPGLYGGYLFGLNPVFGFLSGVVGGEDPYLTIGDVLIADAATVRADFGAWPAPFNIMLGFTAEYTLAFQFGNERDDLAVIVGPRVLTSSNGPGESSAVIGVGYWGATLKLSGNMVDVTFPLSKARDEATWLFVHYHNVKNDADLGSNVAGRSLMAGIAYEW